MSTRGDNLNYGSGRRGAGKRFISRSRTRATFRDPVTSALSSPDNVARGGSGYASLYGSKGILKIVGLAVRALPAILAEVNGVCQTLVESAGDFIIPGEGIVST